MTTAIATDDLEVQLKEALERAEAAEAEVVALKPTRPVDKFLDDSVEGIRARFGDEKLKDIAQTELVAINKRRLRDGMPPYEYKGQELKEAIDRVVEEMRADRERNGAHTEGPLFKTLKMVSPDGNLLQMPYETQINNLAGSIEDAIAIYRNKGFKLTEPLLCPSQNCYNPASSEVRPSGSRGTYRR